MFVCLLVLSFVRLFICLFACLFISLLAVWVFMYLFVCLFVNSMAGWFVCLNNGSKSVSYLSLTNLALCTFNQRDFLSEQLCSYVKYMLTVLCYLVSCCGLQLSYSSILTEKVSRE